MDQTQRKQRIDGLIRLITAIESQEDCLALFEDLCTAKELENMAERCYAAGLLLEGKTYSQVMELSEVSSATLSRISRCVQYGKGYSRLLKKE